MNPSAIYSKSGKGVQEASGKTSLLKRGDRAVLSAIDGRATLAEVAQKVGKAFDAAFEQLISQLDKDGFVREVTAGPSAAGAHRHAPAKAPAAPAKAPAAKAPAPSGGGDDLDFTGIMPALKPAAAPKPAPADKAAEQRAKDQEAALYKARHEAEARAQAERERARADMEAKARAEAEAAIRAETEKKVREEAQAKLKAEVEAKAKLARETAVRLAAEVRAKAEAGAKARIEEAERKAKEEAEKARREAEELRQRLEEERKAREAEEHKRREEEERRRKEEEERRAREEAEARRREEEERRLREQQEQAQRAREEEERARRAHEEEEARARRAQEETKARQPTLAAAPPPAPEPQPEPEPQPAQKEAGPGSLDSLMADLDSFSQREEQERATREAGERKARDAKKRRAQAESDRRAQEQAEHERREAEIRQRKEEEERRAQEEAERRVREVEEQRRLEAEERKRKVYESMVAGQQAAAQAEAPKEDIGVTDQDLDMDDVRRDEAAVSKDARKAQREREREARQREREARERAALAAAKQPEEYKPSKPRRPIKWGRPLAMTLFVLLIIGVGALHIVPLPMTQYEDAASEALGRPVKIASGRLSLLTGVSLNLDGVTIGDTVKIASVHAYPRFGSLIDEKKAFRRIELEGMSIAQQALGETLFARIKGENFSVGRILVKQLKLDGPVPLPALEADAVLGPDGTLRTATLRGPDNLNAKLTPANNQVEFDVTASSFTLPLAPEVTLNSFAMKGKATRQGMNIESWGGSILDGALSGTANVRWGGTWQVDGVVTVRGINAAVFAPALLSEGKAEGTGKFSMSGAEPAKLSSASRIEGNFTVNKGVLGSFDLSRVIQTGGRQFAGRTQFAEMSGRGVYDRGAVALRDVTIGAGALNAGASADIAQGGALSGRIVADVRTASQTLRATLNLGGTVKDPQVRN